MAKVQKTEEAWREALGDFRYQVMRQAATERPFTGEYYEHQAPVGTYHCAACDLALFDATHKYHSGCGWPSFWTELQTAKILQRPDFSHGMRRIELLCSGCESHLGHIFNDGPPPTGQRYCINSVCLVFKA
jgi:peptide-methionine (R)-S-oxide reductase